MVFVHCFACFYILDSSFSLALFVLTVYSHSKILYAVLVFVITFKYFGRLKGTVCRGMRASMYFEMENNIVTPPTLDTKAIQMTKKRHFFSDSIPTPLLLSKRNLWNFSLFILILSTHSFRRHLCSSIKRQANRW